MGNYTRQKLNSYKLVWNRAIMSESANATAAGGLACKRVVKQRYAYLR